MAGDKKKVSVQQVRVIDVFTAAPKQWWDSNAVEQVTTIPGSTVRHLLLTFYELGLLERVDVFGGYRYRLSPTATEQPYFRRVLEAAAVMQQP